MCFVKLWCAGSRQILKVATRMDCTRSAAMGASVWWMEPGILGRSDCCWGVRWPSTCIFDPVGSRIQAHLRSEQRRSRDSARPRPAGSWKSRVNASLENHRCVGAALTGCRLAGGLRASVWIWPDVSSWTIRRTSGQETRSGGGSRRSGRQGAFEHRACHRRRNGVRGINRMCMMAGPGSSLNRRFY